MTAALRHRPVDNDLRFDRFGRWSTGPTGRPAAPRRTLRLRRGDPLISLTQCSSFWDGTPSAADGAPRPRTGGGLDSGRARTSFRQRTLISRPVRTAPARRMSGPSSDSRFGYRPLPPNRYLFEQALYGIRSGQGASRRIE